MKEVYIVAAKRTPIGSFGGALSSISAPQLGAVAIKACIEASGINPNLVEEVFMGNILSANLGQAPARQAAVFAGLSENTPCTTVNKVYASGMKAIMIAAQSIRCGDNDIVIAGGMENMSSVPYYAPNQRFGSRLGNTTLVDGLVHDGLTDVYKQYHMGNAAELCAENHHISREVQDAFAIQSYQRAANAWENQAFQNEIAPVEVPQRKGNSLLITQDEEYTNVNLEKIPTLRPVFKKDGTVTAANASTLNDGAAAVLLMSKEKAEQLNLKPLAKIVSYADAALAPELFTIAPAKAINSALKKAQLATENIDFFELNEAFSVVGIANSQLLHIPESKVNILGGAVALGHPLGCSGTRIVVTLTSILNQQKGKLGVASICNGGGGASALIIEAVM